MTTFRQLFFHPVSGGEIFGRRRAFSFISAVILCFFQPQSAFAEAKTVAGDSFSPADTSWMMVASALVLMMTNPGLALFYSGLVRKKNVLGVMMQAIFLAGIMSLVWAMWGYSLTFGSDILGGLTGGGEYLFLRNVTPFWDEELKTQVVPMAGSIPRGLHMISQMMFFIISPTLICGAFAERMKFSSMVLFSVLWGTFVYCPLAHWVWSEHGFLNAFNPEAAIPAFDFAGGTVVHVSSGISALVCAVLVGKRIGYGHEPLLPHNLTYTCVGTALLWVGWFGFNTGNAFGANPQAVNAFVVNHLAGGAGTIGWACMEWLRRGKPSLLGACSGAVAGLVCVTPGCGMVSPLSGMLMGLLSGMICQYACPLKYKAGYDDSLDAFGIHGIGGTVGALLTGVFATRGVIPHGELPGGLLEGNVSQIFYQGAGVVVAALMAVTGSVILLKSIDLTFGLRVSPQDELTGLDISQHGEQGYFSL